MKVLYKWLLDFIDLDADAKKVAEKLTMSGLEVENVINTKDLYKNIVVGKVVGVKNHPNSDKLKVCRVHIGTDELEVVCGAPNVVENKNVVLALPGAEVLGNRLEKVNIKGVDSTGMICSEKELGLAVHSEGIILLDDNLKPGKCIYEEAYSDLDDILFEINITPNRGDCLSHLGIARELSALFNNPLKKYIDGLPKLVNQLDGVSIDIEAPDLCPRYTAKIIRNIKIKPSPDFIKARISLCGMRPINNIVDITNYVMLGYGQPLHAFDYDLIRGSKIIVRRAIDNEKMKTLDGKERILSNSDLVIADVSGAIALAGVMGGENSEVNENTKNILLESAYFDPITIRKTAKNQNLVSEASYRFARGVDILNVPIACEIAGKMMGSFADGEVIDGVYDVFPKPYRDRIIKFRPEKCKAYLGVNYKKEEMESRLVNLGFGVNKKAYEWDIIVPSYRIDVAIEEDIFEEIARMGFYQEITTSLPNIPMRSRKDIHENKFKQTLVNTLVNLGANEIITYSFIREKELEKIKFKLNKDSFVYIKNPLSEEATLMRPTLIPSHLIVAENNHLRMNYDFIFFEIGKKYSKDLDNSKSFSEKEVLGIVFSGFYRTKEWYGSEEKFDYYIVKGFIERFFERICKSEFDVSPINYEDLLYLHPVESAEIYIGGMQIGYFGKIHPEINKNWNLKRDVFVAEIDFELLKRIYLNTSLQYYEFSKFPWTDRDITVIVDEKVSFKEILSVLIEHSGELVKSIRLIDLYKGEKIGTGKKSLTFKLIYQAKDRTLSDEEVNEENTRIAKALLQELNVEFPK
jgi:phenylalanyl-tRNA synthetase beta chain